MEIRKEINSLPLSPYRYNTAVTKDMGGLARGINDNFCTPNLLAELRHKITTTRQKTGPAGVQSVVECALEVCGLFTRVLHEAYSLAV